MPFFDESLNPAATGTVDRFVRRFNGAAYALAVAALYGIVALAFALALSAALLLSGAMLLVVVPLLNAVLPTRLRPFKGGYFTAAALPWYLHNGLLYVVRLTVLPFVTLTPISSWFLRAMGMRIGRRATIGEKATVMGDVIVGDDAVVLPHSVLIPGSRVPPGERWGGAPARPIPDVEWAAYKALVHGPV